MKIEAADLLMVKVVTDNPEASHREAEAKDLSTINVNFRTIGFREVHIKITIINTAATTNPIFREINQIPTEDEAMAGVLNKQEDVVVVRLWGVKGMKNGKILPLCSKFHAFLDGVIECIFWEVLKFVSFCSDFCQVTGPGS